MAAESDMTGVLIVRAWQEPSHQLRIRLTCVSDISAARPPDSTVVVSVEDALAVVRDFLVHLS